MATDSLPGGVTLLGVQLTAFLTAWSVMVYPRVAEYALGFGDPRTVAIAAACSVLVVAIGLYVVLRPGTEESRYNAHRDDTRDAG